ncbi:glutathione S-transferase [Pseudooceanicola sp.]|uniref:glutathione S-transferase n=1 Tax=Pseudooceanicola sp. TaxID=1914328 RepID=UPI004059FD55
MKLYYTTTSPFARKVLAVVHESGLLDKIELAPMTPSLSAPDPTLIASNPLGKIPTLVRDDGPAIYDSRVITRYLDHIAGGTLYPEARIWDVLTLEATADGAIEAAVLMIYEARMRAPEMVSEEWVEAQSAKAMRSVQAVNDRWMGHLAGPLDAGQIAIGCALGYLDFRFDDRGWRNSCPDLSRWYEGFAARPSMLATVPKV